MEFNLILNLAILSLFCGSIISINLSPCAKWNSSGIAVAGNSIYGSSSNELANPTGIFLDKGKKILYIADHNNGRIQVFLLNNSSNKSITLISNLKYPVRIYVDNQETIYIALDTSKRIEKWIKGATQGVQVGQECRGCSALWIDEEKDYVYMSEWIRNRVSKWSNETENTTTVAGQSDRTGATNQFLNGPKGFYFDKKSDTIYVADTGNHRIQKWLKNAEQGITVAGSSSGKRGEDAASLWFPENVFIDDQTNVIYVTDTNNNRIQRWLFNASQAETIIGASGRGNRTDQLNHPTDLAFDDEGNLYVCDSYNNRVQMFQLIDNQLCSKGNNSINE
ncbi:unnamed protein product [Adineta steineri]|uniref:Uncharacterized protein n=1 Tax=Adineta steineri TaxID=433720 RepID=A0A815DUI8_9BILA|nr:unnamed protein product [Adineta steineri]CAF1306229.1 unnamed protein product [Adineta steineri]